MTKPNIAQYHSGEQQRDIMLSLLLITTITIITMILTPPVISHSSNRFQAARDLRVSGVLSGEDYFDSVGGCANYCALLGTGQFDNFTELYFLIKCLNMQND